MAKHFMKKAFANSHGQFKAKAKAAGMSYEQLCLMLLSNAALDTPAKPAQEEQAWAPWPPSPRPINPCRSTSG